MESLTLQGVFHQCMNHLLSPRTVTNTPLISSTQQ